MAAALLRRGLRKEFAVAYHFHHVDRTQKFLLPVDMAEWLDRDHFVYFLIDLVERLDLSGFLKAYRSDGKGGAAYHPAMMLALLLYAYCDGERSSRRIEERCRTDVAYRVVTGGCVPDHTTIARFRDRHEEAIAEVFAPVLGVCLRAGMGDVSLAAIDGSKFACPASLRANRTLAGIEKELDRLTAEIEAELARIAAEVLAASRRADIEDDTLFGPPPPRQPGTLPDIAGLPKKLRGKAARRARLAKAKDVLDADWAAERAEHDQRMAERAAKEARTGKKTRGRKPTPPQRDPGKKTNVTDPDSRVMKGARGYLQGYNAQTAVARDRTNLAPAVVNDENDTAQLHPMIAETGRNLAAAGSPRAVDLFVGDTGYCTEESLAGIDPDGPGVLLATKKDRETRAEANQAPLNEGPIPDGLSRKEEMEWRLGTAQGKAAYRQRGATVEPAFGQTKHNRGFTRFLRVGPAAADSEWKLINTTDNIRKLHRRVLAGKAEAAWANMSHLLASPSPAG
jgi:transposase